MCGVDWSFVPLVDGTLLFPTVSSPRAPPCWLMGGISRGGGCTWEGVTCRVRSDAAAWPTVRDGHTFDVFGSQGRTAVWQSTRGRAGTLKNNFTNPFFCYKVLSLNKPTASQNGAHGSKVCRVTQYPLASVGDGEPEKCPPPGGPLRASRELRWLRPWQSGHATSRPNTSVSLPG